MKRFVLHSKTRISPWIFWKWSFFHWVWKIRLKFGWMHYILETSDLGMSCRLLFFMIFFFAHCTSMLEGWISSFLQKKVKFFYLYWERFKDVITTCSHHGFDSWLILFYFYEGMFPQMKHLFEIIRGRDYISKSLVEAIMDPQFSCVFPLNVKTHFYQWKLDFEKLELPLIFVYF